MSENCTFIGAYDGECDDESIRGAAKTKAPYVVKLLPIAVELIEKYRGVNEFKVSPDRVFPVGEIGSMEDSLKRIGEKAGCSVRVSPHVGRT